MNVAIPSLPSGVVHELFAPETGSRYILMADQDVILGIGGMAALQHVFYPCVHLRGDVDPDLLEVMMTRPQPQLLPPPP